MTTESTEKQSPDMKWFPLRVPPKDLRLDITLYCGQAFRWIKTDTDEYACAFHKRLIVLKQTPTDIQFFAHPQDQEAMHAWLHNYFQLAVDLDKLYDEWSTDGNFKKKAAWFHGIRMLRQDPVENVFSFICSSNNNIPRITQMIHNLCKRFGTHTATYKSLDFYSFPPVDALIHDSLEQELRDLGFGYRAKYISQSARFLSSQEADYLTCLRKLEYAEAKTRLLKLVGVGPKVADCVLLMSCDKTEAIPVDTHVLQIAVRDYKFIPKSKSGSLSGGVYELVQTKFKERFGVFAGWAHSVLFAADLARFKMLDGSKNIDNESDEELAKKENQIESEADVKIVIKVKVEVEDKDYLTSLIKATASEGKKRKRPVKAVKTEFKEEIAVKSELKEEIVVKKEEFSMDGELENSTFEKPKRRCDRRKGVLATKP